MKFHNKFLQWILNNFWRDIFLLLKYWLTYGFQDEPFTSQFTAGKELGAIDDFWVYK